VNGLGAGGEEELLRLFVFALIGESASKDAEVVTAIPEVLLGMCIIECE